MGCGLLTLTFVFCAWKPAASRQTFFATAAFWWRGKGADREKLETQGKGRGRERRKEKRKRKKSLFLLFSLFFTSRKKIHPSPLPRHYSTTETECKRTTPRDKKNS